MKSYAIILGGGSGRRMEADRNKVFLPLRGIPAIVRAIAPFSGLCARARWWWRLPPRWRRCAR